jgi:hypothetical protein
MLRVKRANGTTVQIPTYRVGDLAVFRRAAIEDGHSIAPEKWSLEDLAKIRLRDSALFAANYMNRPADDVTATFKEGLAQVVPLARYGPTLLHERGRETRSPEPDGHGHPHPRRSGRVRRTGD